MKSYGGNVLAIILFPTLFILGVLKLNSDPANFTFVVWYWIAGFIAVLGAAAALAYLYRERCIRCPQCSRRLRPRKELNVFGTPAGSTLYVYDCHDCQITWNSGYVEEKFYGD
ncbi:MAG TPA: hypothetical protein VGO57_18915 [Verrucomicrobiae bacterium]